MFETLWTLWGMWVCFQAGRFWEVFKPEREAWKLRRFLRAQRRANYFDDNY